MEQLAKIRKTITGKFSKEETKAVIALFIVFSVILGLITFILYPEGITYSKYPLIHFSLFIFGMTLVYASAPEAISTVRISKLGTCITIVLVIIGLASLWPAGDFTERSVKLFEILFQDFVIAGVLSVIGRRLSNTYIRIVLSLAFAALHLPLFFTAPLPHALSIVSAAFLVSYIGTSWFQKTKYDISTITVMHLAFYILFGSVLAVVVW